MQFITFKQFLNQQEELMLEAVDYKQMFTKFLSRIDDNSGHKIHAEQLVDAWIARVQRELVKNVRIVWSLKFVLLGLALEFSDKDEKNLVQFVSQLLSRMQQEFNMSITALEDTGRLFRQIHQTYKEYLDLNIREINEYNPHGINPARLFDTFKDIKRQEEEKKRGKIYYVDQPLSEHEKDGEGIDVIIDFKNGWYWVDLRTSRCDLESGAMEHCGSGSSDSRLISLRELVKEKSSISTWYWKPHITAEWYDDGKIGQMKGKGNQNPSQKYHPYIVELLKHKDENGDFYVTGFSAGGYKPELDFKLEDLTPEQQKEVLSVNPSLDIINQLKETFKDRIEEGEFYYRIKGFPISDLMDYYQDGRNDLDKDFIQGVLNDGYVDYDSSHYNSASEIINIFNFSLDNISIIEKYLDENYEDWREEYNDWEDAVNNDISGDINDSIENAYRYAEEAAYYDSIIDAIKDGVNRSDNFEWENFDTFNIIIHKKTDKYLIYNLLETGSLNTDRYDKEVYWSARQDDNWYVSTTKFNYHLKDVLSEL